MESTISVILTTRNRLASLRRCLESLGRCALPAGWNAEVIVVDNGCSTETGAFVNALALSRSRIHFRYVCEPRQGKAFAVNHGASAAKGSLFAFTDDDIVVDGQWLVEIIEAFAGDPGIALIAGRVVPVDSSAQAVAVTRSLHRTSLNELLSLEGLVLGCNLAVRPLVLEKVKGRDTRLGPGRGLSCEDIDFTHRVLRSGHLGIYLPGPVVYHEPGDRDRRREYLRGRGAFYLKFILSGDAGVTRQAWWYLRGIGKEFADGNRSSAIHRAWHLTVGACMMASRMAFSTRPYGYSRSSE